MKNERWALNESKDLKIELLQQINVYPRIIQKSKIAALDHNVDLLPEYALVLSKL